MKSKRNISVTGSEEFNDIRLEHPEDYAAGAPAVAVTMKHAFQEMGILRAMKPLFKMNKTDGFDCPSCAWPDPEPGNRSPIAEYCENGAKALADEATTKQLHKHFFQKHSVEELSTWSDYEIGKYGRLIEPLILKEGSVHYEPISWETAYETIAKHLEDLDHPDQAIFYTSGRSSNEAAFIYGLFARAFGTNNMPDCSNMCHEASGTALKESLGIGKGSVKLQDLHEAEVIMILGQNPGTNHPRMLSALQKCKENGGKIIAVNPLCEAGLSRFKNPQQVTSVLSKGTVISDIHLAVKINQDVPLLKIIFKKLHRLDQKNGKVFDHAFIQKYTEGFDKILEDLATYTDKDLIQMTGLSESEIDKVVHLLATNSKIIICWAMGLTQHKNAVDNINECVNLLLAKGSLGKPGAGTCPVRGHSNVQGDRSVGIMHYVSKKLNKAINKTFHFDPPEEKGYDTVHAMQAMHDGKAKVFIGLGGNFVSATSDTNYTAQGLQNCDLTVQISTKLNRTHLTAGKTAIILPTLGRSEIDMFQGKQRFITVENSTGKVHSSKGVLKPTAATIKSEPEIIGGIAQAYFKGNHPVKWKELSTNYQLIREGIDKVHDGFTDMNKRSKEGGFYLPNNVRELDFSSLPNGKAQFLVGKLPRHELKTNEFILMTIRSHDQFNTTIYGLNDRYRGIHNERRVLFMNKEDMVRQGLQQMDVVDMISNYDNIERRAKKFLIIAYKIPKGNLAAYFPETNVLVPYNHFADKCNTPISKSVIVSVIKRG